MLASIKSPIMHNQQKKAHTQLVISFTTRLQMSRIDAKRAKYVVTYKVELAFSYKLLNA
jgi:hypothetical protein